MSHLLTAAANWKGLVIEEIKHKASTLMGLMLEFFHKDSRDQDHLDFTIRIFAR